MIYLYLQFTTFHHFTPFLYIFTGVSIQKEPEDSRRILGYKDIRILGYKDIRILGY